MQRRENGEAEAICKRCSGESGKEDEQGCEKPKSERGGLVLTQGAIIQIHSGRDTHHEHDCHEQASENAL